MGRSITPQFVIRKARTKEVLGEWRVKARNGAKGYGYPTTDNISNYRDAFNKSLLPGGVNAHLTTESWLQCSLEIFDQFNKTVVAYYNAPMFEVIP
jgi:hypothetical protein